MARLSIVVCLLAFCGIAFGKRYCQTDDDCNVLGDLTCQKSLCTNWGICGCPRGQASKFVGTVWKFQCLTLKRIGESCSTDGLSGLCGPEQSECVNGNCACETGTVSIWDGERCSNSVGSGSSETCSDSLGNCGFDTSTCRSTSWWTGVTSPFDGVPATCACDNDEQTIIPNAYDVSAFVGRREPQCAPIAVGDKCMRNTDCNNVLGTGASCVNFVCVCDSGSKRNDGLWCGTVLIKGAQCYDGTSGSTTGNCGDMLVCGDVCDIPNYIDTSVSKNCECATGYSDAGASCVPITSGSACSGDGQCKSLGYDALCLDGACQSGSNAVVMSVTSLILALIANILMH